MSLDRMAARLAQQASESGDAVSVGLEISSGPSETQQKRYRVFMVVAEMRERPLVVVPHGQPLN